MYLLGFLSFALWLWLCIVPMTFQKPNFTNPKITTSPQPHSSPQYRCLSVTKIQALSPALSCSSLILYLGNNYERELGLHKANRIGLQDISTPQRHVHLYPAAQRVSRHRAEGETAITRCLDVNIYLTSDIFPLKVWKEEEKKKKKDR